MPLIQVSECKGDDEGNPGRYITVKGTDLMNSIDDMLAKAVDYSNKEDYAGAIMFYKMAYDLNNDEAVLLYEIANCNFLRGEYMKCLKQCNEAFVHPEANDKMKEDLGLLKAKAAYMSGDMWVAVNTFEKLLRKTPAEELSEIHLIIHDLVMEKEKLIQKNIEIEAVHPNWFPANEHQLRLINTSCDNDPVLTPIIDLAKEAEDKQKKKEMEFHMKSMEGSKTTFLLAKPREAMLRDYRK